MCPVQSVMHWLRPNLLQVPDINVKELMVEIELVANTLLEWTPAEGWKVCVCVCACVYVSMYEHVCVSMHVMRFCFSSFLGCRQFLVHCFIYLHFVCLHAR